MSSYPWLFIAQHAQAASLLGKLPANSVQAGLNGNTLWQTVPGLSAGCLTSVWPE